MILGEIGDIHRFSNPNKLLAFAALDPSVYQSGNFQAKTTRMSKRGSRVLRYTFVTATCNVVKNNATFNAYYDAKRAKVQSHYNVLEHCADKLLRVIWKMPTDNVTFNLEQGVCISISIDLKKMNLPRSFIKVILFTIDTKKRIFY